MASVLLAGGGLQAISAARSLHDEGYTVGLYAPAGDYSLKSSAISFSGTGKSSDGLEPLICFINCHQPDVVIPMSDLHAELLSRNRIEIESRTGCRVAVTEHDKLSIAADKQSLMRLCKERGLPHPITEDADELMSNGGKSFPFPALIKPNHSVGARGITRVDSMQELSAKLPSIEEKYGKCHVQEFISGGRPYFNVMLFIDSAGKLINTAVLEIIRYYPLQGGSSSMCRTVERPDLVEICVRCLREMDYRGFADFDVLQTERGEYRIIEINPRVPASLRGAYISGINFPSLILRDALGQKVKSYPYNPGKTLRYLGLDILWFLSSPQRFDAGWFRFWGKDIYYQEGGAADLKAMTASLLGSFNKLEFRGGKLRKKTNS